jgi:hypothetical protein
VLAYIDTRPFLFAFGIVAALILIVGCRVIGGRWPSLRVVTTASGISLALFLFFFYGPFVGHIRRVTHQMQWRIEPKLNPDYTKHVILTFRDYPGQYIGICSDELADYLEKLPSHDVPVEFDVTYDYGNVRGFSERKIGDLTSWRSDFGCGAVQGSPTRSPF